ncbi:MAG: hypothetical protein ACHWZW_09390 [Spirulina sp.]
MQVLENTHRRLYLTFNKESRSHWLWAIISLLVAAVFLGILLTWPTHVLTCWAEAEDAAVQCRATQRRLWQQRPQFYLAEVQEVSLLKRSAPWWSDDDYRYALVLASPTGEEQTFAGQTSELQPQEAQAIALIQYLADPQPQPWVYRVPPHRGVQWIGGGFTLLTAITIGILPLRRPVMVALEMDRPRDQIILTDACLHGNSRHRTYRLSEVVKVELCHEWWRDAREKRLRLHLQSGSLIPVTTEVNLMTHVGLADQRRAAELMRQFLNLP